ncbi:MAG: type II CAAX endopeptidase family protein [Mycobacterium sp.]
MEARHDQTSIGARWGLGAFLVVQLVYSLVSVAFVLLYAGGGQVAAWQLAFAVAAPGVVAAGLVVLITKWRGNGPRTDLRLHWSWRSVGLGLAFGFGGLVISLPAAAIYVAIVGPDANSAVSAVFGGVHASWPVAVIVCLIVVFVAPFCEEVVYRGMLWGALERRWGKWVALVVSTVVFALAHLEFARLPLLLVVAIPIALARLYSGGLIASVVAHQVTNVLPGVIVMLGLVGVLAEA